MKICERVGIAVAGCGVWLICAAVGLSQDATGKKPSEQLLPNSTRAWISVPDPKALNDAFAITQLGQLAHDERLKPFVDDLREQIRARMNEDQLRHGIKLSEFEALDTGEICIAGVLPRDAAGEVQRNKHGVILLIDVSKCKDKAAEILKKAADDLRKNNAVSSTEKFSTIEATKWTFPLRPNATRQRVALHAIAGDWLISADNADLFGQVINRITVPATPAEGSLANDKIFIELIKRSQFDAKEFRSHVRWFVDPFGYLDLARLIAEEDQDPETKQRSTKFAEIVSNSGIDAIKGAAGSLALATGDQEILHRTFIYAPAVEAAGANKYPKAAAILDFFNRGKLAFDPESWVPETAASYATFTWNLEKVVNNVYHVVDAATAPEAYEHALKNIKETNNVDVRKLVECLNNRISIVTEIVAPIDANCEKVVVGIGVKKDAEFVQMQVQNYYGGALKTELVGDIKIYSEEVPVEDDSDDIFGEVKVEVEQPGDLPEGEANPGDGEPDAGGAARRGEILSKSFVAVHNDTIFVSNDKEYLTRVLTAKPQDIGKNGDFVRIREMLNKFTNAPDISLRHFSRLDRVLEANYELARRDELQSANTFLAKLMGAVREEAEKNGGEPRKFDPSKMPEYESVVATQLGATGWVVESKDDGWLITSLLLKREAPAATITADSSKKQ